MLLQGNSWRLRFDGLSLRFWQETNLFATLTRLFFSQTSTRVHQLLIPTHNHEVTPYTPIQVEDLPPHSPTSNTQIILPVGAGCRESCEQPWSPVLQCKTCWYALRSLPLTFYVVCGLNTRQSIAKDTCFVYEGLF